MLASCRSGRPFPSRTREETSMRRITVIAASLLAAGAAATAAVAQQGGANMSFFVTSAGSGRGADLGGLEGADRHCQELAAKAGAGSRSWRAYLSTQGAGAVNARDRIGRGPWQNAKGEIIAQSVDDLPRRFKHDLEADGADRDRRAGERPRRHAEHARHPDRLAGRRPRLPRRRRHDLPQLDVG